MNIGESKVFKSPEEQAKIREQQAETLKQEILSRYRNVKPEDLVVKKFTSHQEALELSEAVFRWHAEFNHENLEASLRQRPKSHDDDLSDATARIRAGQPNPEDKQKLMDEAGAWSLRFPQVAAPNHPLAAHNAKLLTEWIKSHNRPMTAHNLTAAFEALVMQSSDEKPSLCVMPKFAGIECDEDVLTGNELRQYLDKPNGEDILKPVSTRKKSEKVQERIDSMSPDEYAAYANLQEVQPQDQRVGESGRGSAHIPDARFRHEIDQMSAEEFAERLRWDEDFKNRVNGLKPKRTAGNWSRKE